MYSDFRFAVPKDKYKGSKINVEQEAASAVASVDP